MITCKECKFWKEAEGLGMHDMPGEYTHTCVNPIVNVDNYAEYLPAGISSFETIGFGPDFGCIHGIGTERNNFKQGGLLMKKMLLAIVMVMIMVGMATAAEYKILGFSSGQGTQICTYLTGCIPVMEGWNFNRDMGMTLTIEGEIWTLKNDEEGIINEGTLFFYHGAFSFMSADSLIAVIDSNGYGRTPGGFFFALAKLGN
jgi:hypothetical protein